MTYSMYGLFYRVSVRGVRGQGVALLEPFCLPLEIVLLKFIIDVDKCLTKCMSSESMHM